VPVKLAADQHRHGDHVHSHEHMTPHD
jgi:hypothetical protein